MTLPAVLDNTLPILNQLTETLGVPRDILASDQEIQAAWNNFRGVINKIPPTSRTEGLARMCVAVAAGLLDSAINYICNTPVIELREKAKRFGLPVVEQLLRNL